MGYSFSEDTGDGVKITFPFSFSGPDNGYFDATHIKVEVDDVDTGFTLTGPTQVTLTSAPISGAKVRVLRKPPIEVPYTDFERGNSFGKSNINRSFQQQLYLTHRYMDGFKEDGAYEKQDLSMGTDYRITNLADGEDDQDAATVKQLTASVGGITPGQTQAIEDNSAHRGTLNGNPHVVTKDEIGLSEVTNHTQLKASQLVQIVSESSTDIPSNTAVIEYVADNANPDSNSYIANVKAFGAVGDGITDDTAALVAARDSIVVTGGILYFPGGIYLTDELEITTTTTEDAGPRISIRGDGINSTSIRPTLGTTDVISFKGNEDIGTAAVHSYQFIEDLEISRSEATKETGAGLKLSDLAYFNMTRVLIEKFDIGIVGEDILSLKIDNCFIKSNRTGMTLVRASGDYQSDPNAIGIYQSVFGDNTYRGILCTGGTLLSLYGGSFEGTGYWAPDTTSEEMYAIKMVNPGREGCVGLNLSGVYFENNRGTADVWIANSSYEMAHAIIGCSFNRISAKPLVFTESCIRVESLDTLRTVLSLNGSGFKSSGSYIADASRPTVNKIGALVMLEGSGNFFEDSVDKPIFDNTGGTYDPTEVESLYSGGVAKINALSSSVVLPTGVSFNVNATTNLTGQVNATSISTTSFLGVGTDLSVVGSSTLKDTSTTSLDVTGQTTTDQLSVGTSGSSNNALIFGSLQVATSISGAALNATGLITGNGGFSGAAGTHGAAIRDRVDEFYLSHHWTGSQLDLYIGDTNVKTFVIDHPLHDDMLLVHGTLEGPEGAVYYRGSNQLKDGVCTVSLPEFFEELVRDEGRTVILTNVDGFDPIAVTKSKVKEGVFTVYSSNLNSTQCFDWEVKGVRSDIDPLIVERMKADTIVKGDGPYTYI